MMSRCRIFILCAAAACYGGAAKAADAPRGATGCLGCHAAKANIDGAPVRLNGRNPVEITNTMQAFALGQKSSTVMGRIAKGFSDVETRAIAEWLAQQP
jgi:cytochrome c553